MMLGGGAAWWTRGRPDKRRISLEFFSHLAHVLFLLT